MNEPRECTFRLMGSTCQHFCDKDNLTDAIAVFRDSNGEIGYCTFGHSDSFGTMLIGMLLRVAIDIAKPT